MPQDKTSSFIEFRILVDIFIPTTQKIKFPGITPKKSPKRNFQSTRADHKILCPSGTRLAPTVKL